MTIYKKINNIMQKVSAVTKDKKVGVGKNAYRVATYDRLLAVIRTHLIDEEVLVIPSQINKGVYTEVITKNGDVKLRYDAMYDVAFISVEDGSSFSINTEVSADTFGDDKAPSKAITIATKNAILKAFSIETGDEIEIEIDNKVNNKQLIMLQKLVQATGTNEEEFLNYYNADTYADFSQAYFQGAIDALQRKQKTKRSTK